MGREFPLTPRRVPQISTANRRIVTPIPAPASIPRLEELRKHEPASMGGQPPVIWHEGEGFTEQMVLRGSLERLPPVLMTALTAGIGLIPLVLAGHPPGREILYPVATVILGGLITATFCEFLIHPGLFWRFSGRDAENLNACADCSFFIAEVPEIILREPGAAFHGTRFAGSL